MPDPFLYSSDTVSKFYLNIFRKCFIISEKWIPQQNIRSVESINKPLLQILPWSACNDIDFHQSFIHNKQIYYCHIKLPPRPLRSCFWVLRFSLSALRFASNSLFLLTSLSWAAFISSLYNLADHQIPTFSFSAIFTRNAFWLIPSNGSFSSYSQYDYQLLPSFLDKSSFHLHLLPPHQIHRYSTTALSASFVSYRCVFKKARILTSLFSPFHDF